MEQIIEIQYKSNETENQYISDVNNDKFWYVLINQLCSCEWKILLKRKKQKQNGTLWKR